MINKKNLWFLTLFSMVLVLSIYYVTMPNELLITNNGESNVITTSNEEKKTNNTTENNKDNKDDNKDKSVNIETSDVISALKVEDENKVLEEINNLKKTLTDMNVNIDDKNKAFEQLKDINQKNSLEEKIETKLKEKYNKECFVKIDKDQVRVVMGSSEHNVGLANEIMRLVQENFNNKMYVSVQFQK